MQLHEWHRCIRHRIIRGLWYKRYLLILWFDMVYILTYITSTSLKVCQHWLNRYILISISTPGYLIFFFFKVLLFWAALIGWDDGREKKMLVAKWGLFYLKSKRYDGNSYSSFLHTYMTIYVILLYDCSLKMMTGYYYCC